MSNNDIIHYNSDDDLGDFDLGDFDFAPEEGDLLGVDGVDSGGLVTQHSNFSGKPPRSSTSSTPEMSVVSSYSKVLSVF